MAKKYTFDFKKQVIEHYFNSNDGYGLTARRFQMPAKTVEWWVNLYRRKECVLTENQLQDLEKSKASKEAHGEIETHHPGYLCAQDT